LMKQKVVIYWSRRDFRTEDNPALAEALKEARKENLSFLPIFILEPYMITGNPKFQFGLPSRYFLSEALPLFAQNFKSFFIIHSQAARFFIEFSKKHDVLIYVNEDVHPDFYTQLKKLGKHGIEVKLYKDQLTVNKDTKTGSGNIYSVFTPFKKAVWMEFIHTKVLRKPSFDDVSFLSHLDTKDISLVEAKSEVIYALFSKNESLDIEGEVVDLGELALPKRNYKLLYKTEKEAVAHFRKYMKEKLSAYKDNRDSLELDITSNMSIALTWGLVCSHAHARRAGAFR
ncbi:MAG: deoxyribodipyrimidine photo-lyase, partial [Candidatus Paceibacterota bacterium]